MQPTQKDQWQELYPKTKTPAMADMNHYIGAPAWQALCRALEEQYRAKPKIEHSCCSLKPGWNLKYKKSGRSLCTLYPAKGFFTCLVVISDKNQAEMEGLLPTFAPATQKAYRNTPSANGGKWLMLDVTDEAGLQDVQRLIAMRMQK